jgi:hypothetical protein
MRHQLTESKMQGWRAVAVAKDGSEHLIFVGMSFEQVKKNYSTAFFALLTEEEQNNIKLIQMQRWNGVPDSGKWVAQDALRMPVAKKNQILDDEDDMEVEDVAEMQSV